MVGPVSLKRMAARVGIGALLTLPLLASPAQAAPPDWVAGALADVPGRADQIIFAARNLGGDGHWYANFAYYARDTGRKAYGPPGGKLLKLDIATGNVTALLDDPQGSIRDPQVHYDAKKIVFSWRKKDAQHFNLFEINVDGTGLKQLTSGDWDDIEPTYMPDDSIVFVSSRAKRWVNCWLTQVAILHRCDADGKNIRPISSNLEQDNTPWPLPDGRVLYQRWEYVDRSQVDYHHLWTSNPDGTNQTNYYGNMHPGTVMIDAKPIPGTDLVLSIFSPGHGAREHEGPFFVVDPKGGPDDKGHATRIGGKAAGRDPYPIGQKHVLYAVGKTIRLINYDGQSHDLYSDPTLPLHEPRPVVTRQRERIIPARTDLTKETGKLILADVHIGRNMEGISRGDIKKLLVVESLPKPINYTGGMDPLSYGGTFTLERVVGTVPVEDDGSAYLELPALRSYFFVALDENNLSVKRMQSFLTVQPGETLSCIGCHEQRTQTMLPSGQMKALKRKASKIEPLAGVPEVLDFPRDIQPILNKHCVACHDYDRALNAPPDSPHHGPRAGGVILTGDHGPLFSHSYYMLTVRRQFADGRNQAKSNYAPRQLGSAASPLMKKVDGSHYGAKLNAQEIDVIRYWIESGSAYPGTYAALGTGMIGGYDENNQVLTDYKWPQSIAASKALQDRCAKCHVNDTRLASALSEENKLSFWRPDWNDPKLNRTRHILYNLSRPEKSLILLAPLDKAAGGYGLCGAKTEAAPFKDKGDPDYQKILAMVIAGHDKLNEIKRFDMPGFQPEPAYLREMKRYGVLPAAFQIGKDQIDVYALDQAYWKSLWWKPIAEKPVDEPAKP